MQTRAFRVAIIGLSAVLGLSNEGLAQASNSMSPEIFDHIRQATISIGQIRSENGIPQYKTVGSGIIVTADGRTACILTANHMFLDPQNNWQPVELSVRVPPPPGVQAKGIDVTVQLIKNGRRLWYSTADADLAALPFPNMAKNQSIHAIATSEFGGVDDIYQGASILVLGYPALVGENFLSTPLARGGIVSWDSPVAPTEFPFLVDANLYPGNSGGPVFHVKTGLGRTGAFMISGGGVALIGIVSQGAMENVKVMAGGAVVTATDPQTGKASPAEVQVAGIGGIGVIEPISRAKSILGQCLAAR